MYSKINKFFSYLCILLPVLMITGPAIPDIVISFCSLLFILNIFFEKKFEYLKDQLFILFLLFWISLVLSSLLSNYFLISISSSILYIRFIFFVLYIKYYASKFDFVQKYFLLILTLTLFFVGIDSLIQSFYGVDLLRNKLAESNSYRLDGPFGGEEWIIGSFISQYYAISVAYLYTLKTKYIKTRIVFTIFAFVIFYYVTFISGERMAFIMMNFIIICFLILNRKFIKHFLLISIIIIPILLISFSFNNIFFDRFVSTLDILGISYTSENLDKSFWDSHYGAHYLTTIEIFKNHPIVGAGPKSFREECKKNEYSDIKSELTEIRCSTHPHNYYFQILSEGGLVAFILFLIFISYIVMYYKKYYIPNDYTFLSIYLSIIAFLWPIKSTGNILNNRYALFLFYLFMLIIILVERNKKNHKDNYEL